MSLSFTDRVLEADVALDVLFVENILAPNGGVSKGNQSPFSLIHEISGTVSEHKTALN